jgi:hypothetical protein
MNKEGLLKKGSHHFIEHFTDTMSRLADEEMTLKEHLLELQEKIERLKMYRTGYTRNPPGSNNIDNHYKVYESQINDILSLITEHIKKLEE